MLDGFDPTNIAELQLCAGIIALMNRIEALEEDIHRKLPDRARRS